MTDLGTLGGSRSEVEAINEAGQVVGSSLLADGSQHAFIWQDRVMTDLGTLGGSGSQAFEINEAGQVLGRLYFVDESVHPFIWENGVMTDLGSLGGRETWPLAINETGQIIGNSELVDGSQRAFIWQDGEMTDLGTLGGSDSDVSAINDVGQIVGSASLADGRIHAFVTSANWPLPTVDAGGPYSVSEGGSVAVSASGADHEGGPLTYDWDLDNNGTFETAGQNVTLSAASLDGPGSRTIAVQATDAGGLTASATATVNVLNVAPTANVAVTTNMLVQGQSATLAFSSPFDPGAADTTAGFQYSYDCTNDGAFELANSSLTSFACAYPAAGVFTARGRIADKDGGFTDYFVAVAVQTPRQGIATLSDQVNALPPGTLSNGQLNTLNSYLDMAFQKIGDNVPAAIRQLQSFVSQVDDLINTGDLTAAQGQPLIDTANAIIAALSP
jgi:probable HAF family extracellular repeat protein